MRALQKLLPGSAALAVSLAAIGAGAAADDRSGRRSGDGLIARSTGGTQLRDTVPITHHSGGKPRSVFSRPLPRVERGDRVSFNGEVALTLRCLDLGTPRCHGRPYGFSPHLRAGPMPLGAARSRSPAGPRSPADSAARIETTTVRS